MRKVYKIGPLHLDADAGVLTHDGAMVALGARGVAVLAELVSRPNECVRKATILDAAWPGLVVGEANLAVQISAIRRALARVPGGEGWIETLARRGYRFVGPVAAIGSRSAPPAASDRKRTNLPESMTSFVGRERELAEIKQRLPATRVLTLTGTGGIGKTRLAQQAAAEILDAYRDGVWFVDLAPLADPALVPSALAQVLQVKETAGQPLLAVLYEHLRRRETLLILDNCEHVLDACARLTEALLRETARVTVLATSREPLHLAGEVAYSLGALPLPDPKADAYSIARSDAVQLFLERVHQQRPNFDLQEERARSVAEICVRLDGIPLALELAAARVAVLPVAQIVRLLDQRFRLLTSGNRELPRHQTLRAMIDWSYELLDDAEKSLFVRLSVFAGGWTLAACVDVCGGEPIAKDEVVYVLIGLIEQSLVVADEDGDRYRMLETVRDYAKEKLGVSGGADQVRHRHMDYFLAFAEEAAPRLAGPETKARLQGLEQEHDNLRSSMEWSLYEVGSAVGLRLCAALHNFWLFRGHVAEGREWCTRILAKEVASARTPEYAKALFTAGTLAYFQSDYRSARALLEDSLAICRERGDREGIARSLNNLGNVVQDQGDYAAARALYEECLPIARELRNRRGIAALLHNLADVADGLGDHSAVRALYEESLSIMRELKDQAGISATLCSLGDLAYRDHDFASARAMYEGGLAISRELRDQRGLARCLLGLAGVARELGDSSTSWGLSKEALAIFRELGDRLPIAISLEGLAASAAARDSSLHAAGIWGAAERLREDIGSRMLPSEQSSYDRRVAAARATLGDDAAFERVWQEGRTMALEQAIDLSLEEAFGKR